jgi:hypothetical protein
MNRTANFKHNPGRYLKNSSNKRRFVKNDGGITGGVATGSGVTRLPSSDEGAQRRIRGHWLSASKMAARPPMCTLETPEYYKALWKRIQDRSGHLPVAHKQIDGNEIHPHNSN